MATSKATPATRKKKQAKNAAPKGKKTTPAKAKKAAPKARSKKNSALLEAAREVLPRLQAGETTLSAERDRLGLSNNGLLRKALTQLLGGKPAYQKMMAARQKAGKKKASA